MRFFLISLLACPCAVSAQIKSIDDAALQRASKKPSVTAAPADSGGALTKGLAPRPPQQETTSFDFTKAVRIVSRPDGSLAESALVEIPLRFDAGQPTLRTDAQSQANLRGLAAMIRGVEAEGARFTVGGFASAEGDGAVNQKLSEDRAATVRAALIGLGIKETTLTATGFGTRFTTAKATDPEPLRSLDRKVLAVRDK